MSASYRKLLFKAAALASVVCGFVFALTLCASAFEPKGRLTGLVINQTKTPIAGVTVIATNQVTRRTHHTKSNEKGEFSLELPAGAYRISLEAPYFARFTRVSNLPERQYVTSDNPYMAEFPSDKDYKAGNFNDAQENVII